jgi:hypothetical protein
MIPTPNLAAADSPTDDTTIDNRQQDQQSTQTPSTPITISNDIWGQLPSGTSGLNIFFQNIHGYKGGWEALQLLQSAYRPHIIGLTELNIKCTFQQKENIYKDFRSVFNNAVTIINHNKDPTVPRTKYKPGGTLTAALGSTTGRVVDKGGDSLGRWSFLTLLGKHNLRVTFITLYRVCRQSKPGPNTVTSQLIREHLRASGEITDPRLQTTHDVIAFLQKRIGESHQIVIMMDANEAQTDSEQHGLLSELGRVGLVSAYTAADTDLSTLPPTYRRGTKCIDHIYVSTQLVPHITSIAILPYDEGFVSDHRGILLQLNTDIFKGEDSITPYTRRIISTNFISRCKVYHTELLQLIRDNRLDKRITEAQDAINQSCTDERIQRFNDLDTEFGRYILQAQRKAKKRPFQMIWSPPLAKAGLLCRYWRVRIRAHQGNYTLSPHWQQLETNLNLTPTAGHTELMEDLIAQLTQAKLYFKETKKSAGDLRQQHLRDRAQFYADQNQCDEETILKNIIKREESRAMFRKLSSLFEEPRKPLLSLLIRNDADDGYALTSEPDIIFQTLTAVNRKQLSASLCSPFLSGHLNILGQDGFTDSTQQLLLQNIPDMAQALTTVETTFLQQCAKAVRPLTKEIFTAKIFKRLASITRESTASSPSGRHYGFYKAAAILDTEDDNVLTIHAALAMTPFRHGFLLDRWKQVTQVMIPKKSQPFFDKLRIIELFEADLSIMTKILMKAIMEHLSNEKDEVSGTYATVRRGSTHSAIFSRLWAYDLARTRRTAISTIDNDAMGCYDRIIPQLLSVFLQRMGVPTPAIKTFITQLTQKERRILTAHGLSEPIEDLTYLGGIGQGNAGGPACYHSQLIPMIRVMEQLTPGYKATDATKTIQYCQHVTSYVDDCNSLLNLPSNIEAVTTESALQLMQTTQETVSTWREIIHLTGGAIAISKSFWTACIGWKDVRGKTTPISIHEVLPQATKGFLIEGEVYPYQDASTCARYLGVRIGLSGDMTEEYTHRMQEAKIFTQALTKISSRREAVVTLRSYYRPKFEYPLPTTTMTRQQLHNIEKGPINALLPKLGYNRHFPRAIVHGPIRYGGLGIKSLYFAQGCLQIKTIISTIRNPNNNTDLLKILLRQTQMDAGTSLPILSSHRHRGRILTYLTPTWVTSVAEFLHRHTLTMIFNSDWGWVPPLQRDRDQYLMDIFLNVEPLYTTAELRSINRVRLYL